jgi:hypothetical protein
MLGRNAIMPVSWMTILLGLCIAATPFLTGGASVQWWNSLGVAGAIVLLTIWEMVAAKTGTRTSARLASLLTIVAGAWLVLASFLYDRSAAYRWASSIEGVLVMVASGFLNAAAKQLFNLVVVRRTA